MTAPRNPALDRPATQTPGVSGRAALPAWQALQRHAAAMRDVTLRELRRLTAGKPPPGPFRYRDLGTMATISPKDAIADIFGLKLHGRLGKLAWATVHIAFLVGWGNRVGVLARWAFMLVGRTRPERVILTSAHDNDTEPAGSPSNNAAGGPSDCPIVPEHDPSPHRPAARQLTDHEKRQ